MIVRRLALLAALALLAPAACRAAELSPHLPPDTEHYLSINVKQVLGSPLVKKYGLDAARDALKDSELNTLFQELGFDPFKHLDRVQFATPNTSDKDRGLIILEGTFDLVKIKKKAEAAARANEESVKTHKVKLGGAASHEIYEVAIPGQELSLFVAGLDNKTLLASAGKDYVVDALKRARLKQKVVLKNRAFQAVVEKLDGKQGVSLAMLGGSLGKSEWLNSLPEAYKDALAGIEAIGGGITFGNEVKLNLLVSTKSDGNARTLREGANKGVRLAQVALAFLGEDRPELKLLGEVLNTVRAGGKGKLLTLSARLTADVLDDLKKDD